MYYGRGLSLSDDYQTRLTERRLRFVNLLLYLCTDVQLQSWSIRRMVRVALCNNVHVMYQSAVLPQLLLISQSDWLVYPVVDKSLDNAACVS